MSAQSASRATARRFSARLAAQGRWMPYGAPDTGPELLSLLGEKVDRFELVKRDSPAQAQGALSHLAVFGVEAPASRS